MYNIDFLIDDYQSLTVLPLEVKSGKDYTIHSALDKFLGTSDYCIQNAVVFSNEQKVYSSNGITYMPIYYIMFIKEHETEKQQTVLPKLTFPGYGNEDEKSEEA